MTAPSVPRRIPWVVRSPWGRSVVYVLSSAVVFGLWLRPIRIRGISMFPTLVTEQIALVDRLAYRVREPARGDIVWLRGGTADEPVYYVKRIVGLPGERLEFRRGMLFVDGERIEEPYAAANPGWWLFVPRIPAAAYYVVGDNRTMHLADHYQGVVNRPMILGRVRFWTRIGPSRRAPPDRGERRPGQAGERPRESPVNRPGEWTGTLDPGHRMTVA